MSDEQGGKLANPMAKPDIIVPEAKYPPDTEYEYGKEWTTMGMYGRSEGGTRVTVKKETLLAALRKNREGHRAVFLKDTVKLLLRLVCWMFGHRYVLVGGFEQERCDRCKRMTRDLPCILGCGAMRHNYVCEPMRRLPKE